MVREMKPCPQSYTVLLQHSGCRLVSDTEGAPPQYPQGESSGHRSLLLAQGLLLAR